ncbi:MAG: class I SAM-dependent rRNA methyltransferase [Ignavibacteria bacterium]|nr:class I SAM-dependent rRNA methyltransferase [Ignavibacteria bacterium]
MKIILKKNEHRRIKSGHLWVFSNEIECEKDFSGNGCIADLYSNNNNFLGRGVYNKNSLIAFRLISYKKEDINKDFFMKAFKNAENKRRIFFKDNFYRLINGESDYLPGLIIDRFNNRFSIQIFSLGMENLKENIVDALIELFSPAGIIEKNDFDYRKLEGLESRKGILFGDTPDEIIAEIDNIKYRIDILKGQKTGFFLDQRLNRLKTRKFINKGDKVLDVFCNDGGFGLNALFSGAGNVTFVDSSDYSLSNCKYNCGLNNFTNFLTEEGNAFDILKKYANEDRKFNLIILDPPSFTKSKKYIKSAEAGYIEINSNAMKLLENNSVLMSYSCSHHITVNMFENIIMKSAAESGRKIEIIGHSEISPDHPILPQMPETEYLKGFLVLVN